MEIYVLIREVIERFSLSMLTPSFNVYLPFSLVSVTTINIKFFCLTIICKEGIFVFNGCVIVNSTCSFQFIKLRRSTKCTLLNRPSILLSRHRSATICESNYLNYHGYYDIQLPCFSQGCAEIKYSNHALASNIKNSVYQALTLNFSSKQ